MVFSSNTYSAFYISSIHIPVPEWGAWSLFLEKHCANRANTFVTLTIVWDTDSVYFSRSFAF